MTNRHLEIPAEDIERAKSFYSELFGWNIERVEGPAEYWLIDTTDEKGERGVGGGMIKRQSPQQTITNYADVLQSKSLLPKSRTSGVK